MKPLLKANCTAFLIAISHAAPSSAGAGLEGELSLLGGFRYSESNFNTDESRKPAPLNSEADSQTNGFVLPLGQIRYALDDQEKVSLFAGASRDDIIVGDLAFELGARFGLSDESSVKLSVLPTLIDDETWEDPYLVNEKRHTTDTSGTAFLINYDKVLDTDFDLSLGYYEKEVDRERSGDSLPSVSDQHLLARDGHGYYLSAKRRITLSENTFLEPALYGQQYSADGDAMAYTRYSAGLLYGIRLNQSNIGLSFKVSDTTFKEDNPVFGRKQDGIGYKVNLAYEYRGFLGMKDWSLVSLSGYSHTDSDIAFFRESSAFTSIGVSYRF